MYAFITKWMSEQHHLKPDGYRDGFGGRRAIDLEGSWLIVAIFLGCLTWSGAMATIGWNNSLSDAHGFRQTNNAITSYYLIRGGPFLRYETPVVGMPWSIPFEFPLYQWIVASAARAFATPLNQTGRFISEVFFVLSLVALWGVLAELKVARICRLIFLSLVLVSPEYIFWSRTFMMESTALFLAIGWLFFVLIYIRTQKIFFVLIGGLFGIFGALVKAFTLPAFMFVSSLYFACSLRREIDRVGFSKSLLHQAIPFLVLVSMPILTAWMWARYTDEVKTLNVVGVHMTSSALRQWYLGTVSTRFSASAWQTFFTRMIPDILGDNIIGWLPVVGLIFAPHRVLPFLVSISAFLLGFLLFTDMHVIHNYYSFANGIFLIIAMGWCILGLLEKGTAYKWVGLAIFIVSIGISIVGYYQRYYTTQKTNNMELPNVSNFVKSHTQPDDLILVFGLDWSPEVPYYSERRALAWPEWMPRDMDAPAMTESLARLGHRRFGALVACNGDQARLQLIQKATNVLQLAEKPKYEDVKCSVYLPSHEPENSRND
ncbi:MAG: hypothetical protein KGL31_05665 [candidate division NC10 bacterium]|nr:hypothetical protein [candidate division NC10 bacterium]MDE2321391.1 hypothetical protein [candidate division NC10 bacterium]